MMVKLNIQEILATWLLQYAASPFASAAVFRNSNASLCSHVGELFPGKTKNLPEAHRSLLIPQDSNDHSVAWKCRI